MEYTAVVNIKAHPEAKLDPDYVYIGRGSRWGNKFSHLPNTKATHIVGSREEAVQAYKIDLWAKIKSGEVSQFDLAELKGKTLGCYCKPQACHGDVLAAAADWAHSELTQDDEFRGVSDEELTEMANNWNEK